MTNTDYMFVFYCYILCVVFLTGCAIDTNATSIPLTNPTLDFTIPTPSVFPSFILNVSPKPATKIPFDVFIKANSETIFVWRENEDNLGYNSSVCVNYNLDSLLKPSAPFVKYITLLINGESVSLNGMSSTEMLCEFSYPDGTTIPYDCNRHAACWEAPFHVGIYEATFQVNLRSGEVKEYTWYYEIVEPVTSPTP